MKGIMNERMKGRIDEWKKGCKGIMDDGMERKIDERIKG